MAYEFTKHKADSCNLLLAEVLHKEIDQLAGYLISGHTQSRKTTIDSVHHGADIRHTECIWVDDITCESQSNTVYSSNIEFVPCILHGHIINDKTGSLPPPPRNINIGGGISHLSNKEILVLMKAVAGYISSYICALSVYFIYRVHIKKIVMTLYFSERYKYQHC